MSDASFTAKQPITKELVAQAFKEQYLEADPYQLPAVLHMETEEGQSALNAVWLNVGGEDVLVTFTGSTIVNFSTTEELIALSRSYS